VRVGASPSQSGAGGERQTSNKGSLASTSCTRSLVGPQEVSPQYGGEGRGSAVVEDPAEDIGARAVRCGWS
jgi:hypothetical protein